MCIKDMHSVHSVNDNGSNNMRYNDDDKTYDNNTETLSFLGISVIPRHPFAFDRLTLPEFPPAAHHTRPNISLGLSFFQHPGVTLNFQMAGHLSPEINHKVNS